MSEAVSKLTAAGAIPLMRYYRFHARLYDATRWSFLFGRKALMQEIAAYCRPRNILEVGCGTGKNLLRLHQIFPEASLLGVDLSRHMLRVARRKLGNLNGKLELLEQPYFQQLSPQRPFDLVIFSYCLSMINPGWEQALQAAKLDLRPGGWIAVVDFHASHAVWFKKWMAINHVQIGGHLLPLLTDQFQPRAITIKPTYKGLWSFFSFIGTRPNEQSRMRGTLHFILAPRNI